MRADISHSRIIEKHGEGGMAAVYSRGQLGVYTR